MNRHSTKNNTKRTLSPEERKKRNDQKKHQSSIRGIFSNIGFTRVELVSQKTQDKIIGTDLDDLFVKDNLLCIVEYTTTSGEDAVMDHFRKKNDFYEEWKKDLNTFYKNLKNGVVAQNALNKLPTDPVSDLHFVFLYASHLVSVSEEHKSTYKNVVFFDYGHVKYFELISKVIKEDAIYEFLEYMNIDTSKCSVGNDLKNTRGFEGHILSEKQTKFAKGMHIFTFYISPEELLKRAYVLRKNSWQDETSSPYQRFLNQRKIKQMREYLTNNKRVYVNNIITSIAEDSIELSMRNDKGEYEYVSFNDNGDILDKNGDCIPSTSDPIFKINIKDDRNIIGIIDGQHRAYSYYKGKENDKCTERINKLRKDHCLLVTGVIMPKHESKAEQEAFEAKLFLEINSSQMSPKKELKMQIESRANYKAPGSIALRVAEKLAQRTPLNGVLVRFWYEEGNKERIGISTLVSYVLKPLVDPKNSPLYSMWQKQEDVQMKHDQLNQDETARFEDYCSTQIAIFLSSLKKHIDLSDKWMWKKQDKKNPKSFLKVVSIGGMINCFKEFLVNTEQIDPFLKNDGYFDTKKLLFHDIDEFNFLKYSGSGYSAMGKDMYQFFFKE
ncbi:DGQHR domain-containing protein [Akkermansia sp.]